MTSESQSFNARTRAFAKQMHEDKSVYAWFGALDGLSMSYSMVKYGFDIQTSGGPSTLSTDRMHDWLTNPIGIVCTAFETIAMTGFAICGNTFSTDDSNTLKRWLAVAWPYFRAVMKALKNAYKGIRSFLVMISTLIGNDYRYLILPLGIGFGIISAFNRIWLRNMVENRKAMMTANNKLCEEIEALQDWQANTGDSFRDRIQTQSAALRLRAKMSAAFGGIIDGLYLYVGIIGIAALVPSIFTMLAVICMVFTVACVVTRVYEEHIFQRKLDITQAEVELLICVRELQYLFACKADIEKLLAKTREFANRCQTFQRLNTLSWGSVTLLALQNGLYAYGAVMSVLFALSVLYSMAVVAFPPALLIGGVLVALSSLLVAFVYTLYTYNENLKQQATPLANQQRAREQLVSKLTDPTLTEEQLAELIKQSIAIDASQTTIQEWLEVIRSCFSGVAKGQKSVDFFFNSFQEADMAGHYRDTPIMFGLTALHSVLFSVVLSLRAVTKGFGRPPLATSGFFAPKPLTPDDPDTAPDLEMDHCTF